MLLLPMGPSVQSRRNFALALEDFATRDPSRHGTVKTQHRIKSCTQLITTKPFSGCAIKETLAPQSPIMLANGDRIRGRASSRPTALFRLRSPGRQPYPSTQFDDTGCGNDEVEDNAACSAPADRTTDFATTVVTTMRQLGVVGLPRNYEIFYEALAGSNHELSLEVVSLSKRPTQDELDRIGRKYFADNHGSGHRRACPRDDRQGARGNRLHPAARTQPSREIRPHPRPDRRGPQQPQPDHQGSASEDRRRDVGGDRFHDRSGQAGREHARRQDLRAGKRQVEARGIQEARRHRSADPYLEPARLRQGDRAHLQ